MRLLYRQSVCLPAVTQLNFEERFTFARLIYGAMEETFNDTLDTNVSKTFK